MDDDKTAEAVAHFTVAMEDYVKALKTLTQMMEAASMRRTVSLCYRDDGPQLLQQARGEQTQPHAQASRLQ
jgi:hypothetical protein